MSYLANKILSLSLSLSLFFSVFRRSCCSILSTFHIWNFAHWIKRYVWIFFYLCVHCVFLGVQSPPASHH